MMHMYYRNGAPPALTVHIPSPRSMTTTCIHALAQCTHMCARAHTHTHRCPHHIHSLLPTQNDHNLYAPRDEWDLDTPEGQSLDHLKLDDHKLRQRFQYPMLAGGADQGGEWGGLCAWSEVGPRRQCFWAGNWDSGTTV